MPNRPRRAFRPARAAHSGFTLIELLVVISIIALLIAIFLPVLTKARETGRTISCLSGLRQVAIASHLYADDNDNMLMPVATLGNNWYNRLVTQGLATIEFGYLPSPEVFFCASYEPPASSVPARTDEEDALFDGTIGYGMSWALQRDYRDTATLPEDIARLDSIKRPSDIILHADTFNAFPDSGVYYLQPFMISVAGGVPSLRHDGASNVSRTDGSASTIRAAAPDDNLSMYQPERLTHFQDPEQDWIWQE